MQQASLPWQSVDYVGGNPINELVRNRNTILLGDISPVVRVMSVSQSDGYWLETAYLSPGQNSTVVARSLCRREKSTQGVESLMIVYLMCVLSLDASHSFSL